MAPPILSRLRRRDNPESDSEADVSDVVVESNENTDSLGDNTGFSIGGGLVWSQHCPTIPSYIDANLEHDLAAQLLRRG